jgi:hypothetical protein
MLDDLVVLGIVANLLVLAILSVLANVDSLAALGIVANLFFLVKLVIRPVMILEKRT